MAVYFIGVTIAGIAASCVYPQYVLTTFGLVVPAMTCMNYLSHEILNSLINSNETRLITHLSVSNITAVTAVSCIFGNTYTKSFSSSDERNEHLAHALLMTFISTPFALLSNILHTLHTKFKSLWALIIGLSSSITTATAIIAGNACIPLMGEVILNMTPITAQVCYSNSQMLINAFPSITHTNSTSKCLSL